MVVDSTEHSDEFVVPVFKKVRNLDGSEHAGEGDLLLYSHHHEGRVWLIGSSLTSW